MSAWVTIDQSRVDAFANATDDHQWIYVDAVRARDESLYGTTIVHGFLLLSLLPALAAKAFGIAGGYRLIINCGLQSARFLRPVPVGSSVRARFTLLRLDSVLMGKEAAWRVVIERETETRPVAEVEWVLRYLR